MRDEKLGGLIGCTLNNLHRTEKGQKLCIDMSIKALNPRPLRC